MLSVNLERKRVIFHIDVKTKAEKYELLRHYWLSCDGLDRYEFPIRTSLVQVGDDLFKKEYCACNGWTVEGFRNDH